MLLAAKNPVLWAGQGVLYAEAGDRLAALAELVPAPVVTTNPGKSAIPENHPLVARRLDPLAAKMFTDFMAKADVVFAVGSSLTKTPFGPSVPPGKTIIHSTNDASDINKEYRVDHAVVGDAALVLDALIAEVDRQKGAAAAATRSPRSRRRSRPARRRGSPNGRSTSIPTRRRSTSTA